MGFFTAIATAIVEYAIGATVVAGTWAAFAVSVVATGLGVIAAKLIGVGSRGGGGTQDQGVRVQLPPATDNKIPVIYGTAYQQPIITDAQISNGNNTMHYVLTLGERTDTGTYTVGDIYWNDQRLNFESDGFTVSGAVGPDGTTSTTLSSLVRCWVWAGGSGSAYQIKGPTPAVNAYDIIPNTSSTYAMTNLVFAVVQLEYKPEKGVTGLPTMTFEIQNSLKNPGDVIQDYLLNSRYGCGFASADVDLDSLTGSTSTSLKSISNQIPLNQYQSDGITTSTQVRYQINGILNTGDTVKNNLERLCIASNSWLTYDHKLGQWRVVVNRAATAGELASAKTFNDDNIIGEISLSSTNLEDLYNELEVAYANRAARDQSDYFKSTIANSLRNDLEPDNVLRMRADMVNNRIHAGRVGLVELYQSRFDLVITFTADYTALESEVGDVIKVSNPIYNFDNKLFRITRVRETEGEDGTLAAEITALQYDSTVYTDYTLVDGAAKPSSDIPTANTDLTLPAPSRPLITATYPSANTPNFTIVSTVSNSSGPVQSIEWFHATTSTIADMRWLDNEIAPTGGFVAGTTITDTISNLIEAGTWYFRARTQNSGVYSDFSEASEPLLWQPQPAGADNGTIANSTNSIYTDNILLNATTPGTTYTMVVAVSDGIGSYVSAEADSDVTYNPDTNKMHFGPWEVSTVSNLVYAQYLSTATQNITTTTNSQEVTLNTTSFSNGISRSNGIITLDGAGIYNLTFSCQFTNSNSGSHDAYIWLRQNGSDVADTTSIFTVPGKHGSLNGAVIATVNYFINAAEGDTVSLYWGAESSAISLATEPAGTSPTRPRTPAIILTIFKMRG